ncbi:MAG: hypothetical protein HUJ71_07760 [Pseudobutyrivibrio sp.]|nr:hypothetical protein [Pseudobutyrivibrio sp.]
MNSKNNNTTGSKRWFFTVLAIVASVLVVTFVTTFIVDPFFHYHLPLDGVQYPINNERYQNDGLTRLCEYNAVITGTSMTSNFNPTQFDELYGVDSMKFSYLGARNKEIDENLRKSYASGHELKYVLRSFDYEYFNTDKDDWFPDVVFPTYLTDDKVLNDVNYLLNKTVILKNLFGVLEYNITGQTTPDKDEMSKWNDNYEFDRQVVLNSYELEGDRVTAVNTMTEADKKRLSDNLQQNFFDLIDQHPETTFILFMPPYSVSYWDEVDSKGNVQWLIEAQQMAIEECFKHSNIELYSFCDDYELVIDLDEYKDQTHYEQKHNASILQDIHDNNHRLTPDNYMDYIDDISQFYLNYDYESLKQ